MSNYKILNINLNKITLFSLISTVTRNTKDLSIPGYNNLQLKVPNNNRGYKIDCISPSDKYNIMVNGEKKSIFDEYEVIATTFYNRSADPIISYTGSIYQNTPDVTINLRPESENGHFTHFRAVLYGGSGGGGSGYYSSWFRRNYYGGGGGGGAYVLSEKISSTDINEIILRPGKVEIGDGGDAEIIVYYNNGGSTYLKAPGGMRGLNNTTYGGGGGGAGSVFNASLHNPNNFSLVQTINGSNGQSGGLSVGNGGNHGSNSSSNLYKDIVVPYSISNGKSGFGRVFNSSTELRWVNTNGLVVVYLYNDEL